MLATVVLILATVLGAVLASQPAYLVTLAVVGLGCVAGILVACLTRPGDGRARKERSRFRVVGVRVAGVVGALLVAAGLLVLRPLPAEPVAVAAMSGSSAVSVVDSTSRIELVGHRATTGTGTGLIFFPGALVDPRAYVPLLTPLAADGFTVDIVKPPYGIAFLSADAPGGIIAGDPAVRRWVVGGHSLGGVVAARYAGGRHPGVRGLLLWASYPSGSLADDRELAVTSVSAGNDGLATPAKIDAARHLLPPQTRYVVVEGAVHADFGDYGTQRGDGTATVPKAEAQRQIEAASLALLRQVAGAGA